MVTINSIVQSHHTVGDVISRIINFNLSMNENVLLITLVAIIGIFALFTLSSTLGVLRDKIFGASLGYQDSAIPDYFSSLRDQDLEELIEEEKVLL